jgi:crossover junction endodeoxyribonuclease RuvC
LFGQSKAPDTSNIETSTRFCERMFVLGIDPGLSRLGFGAVRRTRTGSVSVEHGVLCTPPTDALPARLAAMNAQLRALIGRLKPDAVVVERVFFQTNVRTAMGVAQASGLALAAAYDANCTIAQYTSNEVKLAITGYGAADKGQMQRMVQRILNLAELPKPADAADALGLALHHLAVAPFLLSADSAHTASLASPSSLDRAIAEHAQSSVSPLGNARIATRVGGTPITQTPVAKSTPTKAASPKSVTKPVPKRVTKTSSGVVR